MKKIFTVIGFIALISLSFIYTEKTANFLIGKDKLMMMINEKTKEYNVDPIDGVTIDNTFIPGINGLEIDNKQSYKIMKKYGIFNPELLKFKQIKPKNLLKNNYDKYIVSGNSSKNMVSLIFKVDENDNVDEILEILNKKNIKANFFVDGAWFSNNNEKITDLIQQNHIVGNLSYNLNYNDGAFVWMDTIIKRIGKQKTGYCFAEEENESNLQICSLNKNYTIKPIIIKENYTTNLKNVLKSGAIISFEINDSLKKELPIMINYIISKGYTIDNLNNLLSEENGV